MGITVSSAHLSGSNTIGPTFNKYSYVCCGSLLPLWKAEISSSLSFASLVLFLTLWKWCCELVSPLHCWSFSAKQCSLDDAVVLIFKSGKQRWNFFSCLCKISDTLCLGLFLAWSRKLLCCSFTNCKTHHRVLLTSFPGFREPELS